MKKLLLILFAVLSINAFAQAPQFKANVTGKFKAENASRFKIAKRVSLKKATNANKVKAKAPVSGTTKTYYADYGQNLYNVGTLNRAHVKYDIIFGDNGEVSISNPFLRSIVGENLYLSGKYDATTNEITIDNNQEIYTEEGTGLSLTVNNINVNTENGDPSTEEYKLQLDPQTGIVTPEDENACLGIYLSNGSQSELYTWIQAICYYPEDLFPAAVSHNYTYTDYDGKTQNTTVDLVTVGDICYVRNLMPNYPEAWIPGYVDGNNLSFSSYMVADDDIALLFTTGSGAETEFVDECPFDYNSANDSYTSENSFTLTDYFYYDGDDMNPSGYYLTGSCTDMTISGTTTGISKIENDSKDAVSTEYYDLSGRRISNASKGVNIMVKKFADGTTKAVKVLK